MQLIKKHIKFETETKQVNIFVNPFTSEKNPAIRGFVNISILKKVGDKLEMEYSWNGNSFVELKDGRKLISAPSQKAYTDKDGNVTSEPYHFIPKEVREDVVKRILNEATAA